MAGRVLIWPGRAVYVGPLLRNEGHAHHAFQISIALESKLTLRAGAGRWSAYRAVVTAPDQPHRIRCRGEIAQIYVDPESSAGRVLREQLRDARVRALRIDGLGSLCAALRGWSGGELGADELAATIDEMGPLAACSSSGAPIDPRVRQALAALHASPGRGVPLAVLADRVALSASRLGMLFRRDTGLPLRRYLLWLRLVDAVQALSDGISLTEAAHRSGFSDSAHLSRTFRRMFGMPPSLLQAQGVGIRSLVQRSG